MSNYYKGKDLVQKQKGNVACKAICNSLSWKMLLQGIKLLFNLHLFGKFVDIFGNENWVYSKKIFAKILM